MITRMRTLLQLATIGVFALILGACNTIEGAGQDIQAGGQAIEEAADGEQ